MRNSNAIFQIIIVVVGAIIALTMGLQVGTQDYRTLILWFLIGGALLYVLRGYHYTWQLILFVSFLSFSLRPFGFELNTAHVAFVLAAALAVLTLFRPVMSGGAMLKRAGVTPLQILLFIWIAYGGGHFICNHLWPVYPTEWSLKHALTRYFLAFAGPCIFLWYSLFPKGIDLSKHWVRTILYLTFSSLLINLVVRFYLVFGLGLELHGDRGDFYAEEGMVYIPVINLIPGVEALRVMGPLSAGFAYCLMVHRPWMRAQTPVTRLLVLATFGLGVFGAMFSAGRAAILLAIAYMVIFAVLRRKFFHMAFGFAMVFALFSFANIASHWVKYDAPFAISRSLQYLLVDRGGAADSSIRSSTDWRSELFDRAIDEWEGDQRIFWTGRATMSFSAEDSRIREQLGGYEAAIQTALRRGATHNLVTDLLVQFGLIGLILYYAMCLMLVRFVWKCQRLCRDDVNLSVFGSFVGVTIPLILLYKTVGAGFVEVIYFWFVVLMTVGVRQHLAAKARAAAGDAKAAARSGRPRLASGAFPQPVGVR